MYLVVLPIEDGIVGFAGFSLRMDLHQSSLAIISSFSGSV